MAQRSGLVLFLLALAAAGCSDEGSFEGDGGADTDTDSDTDTSVHDFWDWESLEIPGGFTGHGVDIKVHATAADDATICSGNWTNGTGGILAFDGAALLEVADGFVCEGVFGLDADHLWAFGVVDQTFEPMLYGRSGGEWSLEAVEGADDSCRYDTIYGTSVDDVAIVGWCSAERLSWVPDGSGGWIVGSVVVPTNAELDTIYGVLPLPETDVFYGSGLWESAGATDLGFETERAVWAYGSALADLSVLEGDAVLAYDGAAWTEVLACPDDLSAEEYSICWVSGARDDASGDLYLGGGRGSATNENIDDWRLDRFHDGGLTRILEPCGGDSPRCGVDDVSLSPDGVLFVIANGPGPSLLWHAIPAAD
ncbi:MAG: hypothetical protein M0R80_11600 [Proteobacteria bacterium]|jgi:hypothetical protein|nr:hypothetical protein [Pseudomonadota bacterium]